MSENVLAALAAIRAAVGNDDAGAVRGYKLSFDPSRQSRRHDNGSIGDFYMIDNKRYSMAEVMYIDAFATMALNVLANHSPGLNALFAAGEV